jgi:hypothetical protein
MRRPPAAALALRQQQCAQAGVTVAWTRPRATSSASASFQFALQQAARFQQFVEELTRHARARPRAPTARARTAPSPRRPPASAAQRGNSRRGSSTSGVARTGPRPPLPVSAPRPRSRAQAMRPALH